MNTEYTILKGLPPYGKMYIPIPDGNWSEGLAVEFTKDDGTKWVANIEYGKEGFDYINKLNNTTEIIVISKGRCYIIDRNKEKSIIDFGYDFNKVIEFENKFILIGIRNIAIVVNSEKIYRYKYICMDFIKEVKIDKRILSGFLYDYNASNKYDKTKFTIDLDNYEYKRINNKQRINKVPNNNEKRKWWKIWKW